MAAAVSVPVEAWRQELDELTVSIGGRFARRETRATAGRMISGLCSELPGKNCWTLAEYAGDQGPGRMQHLLAAAVVDDAGLAADLRGYVVDRLGDRDPILVIDETGDLKKGTLTVGVQRQYTGTAGRIENAQVAVYLTYATKAGHAFIDRALYLPKSWTEDPERRQEAGVPAETVFATKPALAAAMIGDALDAGVPAGWVTGDEVYGGDRGLRTALQARGVGYVMAVARNHMVTVAGDRVRADSVAADLGKRARKRSWQVRSAGDGAKGPRHYDWAWVAIGADPAPRGGDSHAEVGGHRWLLIRRNPATGELAFFRCWSPGPVSLPRLVAVAGRRWSIEENFQTSKNLTGLDEHQVRGWRSWHRWTLLVMLAHALLTALAITTNAAMPVTGLIPLTRNEIRHLLAHLLLPVGHGTAHLLRWSTWRRLHQYRAKISHYQRRSERS